MNTTARRAAQTIALAVGALLAPPMSAQTLDLGGPERPQLSATAVVDLVERLDGESASLAERIGQLEAAGADEDILIAARLRLLARTDASALLAPWLDPYSDGWEAGMAGLTIARALPRIDAASERYAALAVAARAPDAPTEAVVAYQRARVALRRFLRRSDESLPDPRPPVQRIALLYASVNEAAAVMEMPGVTTAPAPDPAAPLAAARAALDGAPLDPESQAACAEALERLRLLGTLPDSARRAADAAGAIAECVWLPSLARVEFGEGSAAPLALAGEVRRAAESLDDRSLRTLGAAARMLRSLGTLRRASLDTRRLAPAIERALAAPPTESDALIRVAERVLGVCVDWRALPDATGRDLPRELQRGWRLTARAYEDLERSALNELIAIAEQPARLREPGTVSLLANHRSLAETMRRVHESAGWLTLLAARGDAASLGAAEALAPIPGLALDETTRSGAAERLAALEAIIESLDGAPVERGLGIPGSPIDRASGGRGADLLRVFRRDRESRLLAWARQNDAAESRTVALNDRLLELLELLALVDDSAAVARINAMSVIELDERGLRLAATRVRGPVDEAVTMILRNDVAIAADAIGHAEARAGVLRLVRTILDRSPGPRPGHQGIVAAGVSGAPLDSWSVPERRSCAAVSRMLLEAGDLESADVDTRAAIDPLLAYAEHIADRASRSMRDGDG